MALTDTAGGTQTDPGTGNRQKIHPPIHRQMVPLLKNHTTHPPIPISPLHRKKKRRPARRRNTRSPPLKVRNSIPARWRSSNQWRVN